jgi:hypothetical protein
LRPFAILQKSRLSHCSNHQRHLFFPKAPGRVFSVVPVGFSASIDTLNGAIRLSTFK